MKMLQLGFVYPLFFCFNSTNQHGIVALFFNSFNLGDDVWSGADYRCRIGATILRKDGGHRPLGTEDKFDHVVYWSASRPTWINSCVESTALYTKQKTTARGLCLRHFDVYGDSRWE